MKMPDQAEKNHSTRTLPLKGTCLPIPDGWLAVLPGWMDGWLADRSVFPRQNKNSTQGKEKTSAAPREGALPMHIHAGNFLPAP